MQSKTRLSILMPAYKARDTICRAIESAISTPGVEVIVAPDDGTLEYESLGSQYHGRVTVLDATNRLGPGAGRNRAFTVCTGEYVSMLDSDDSYQNGAIEEALDLCSKSMNNVAFVRSAYVMSGTSKIVRELIYAENLTFEKWVEFGGGSVHAVFPRKLWRPYSENLMAQDLLHDAEILCEAGGVAPLTHNAYHINIHNQSICATTDQARFNRDYGQIIEKTKDTRIKSLFREKIRIGKLYEAEIAKGNIIMYNDFLNILGASNY